MDDQKLERDRMLADLHDELRAAAAPQLRREAPFLTLQSTALAPARINPFTRSP